MAESSNDAASSNTSSNTPSFVRLWLFYGLLGFDSLLSVLFLTPLLIHWPYHNAQYTIGGSFFDLAVLAAARILFALAALLIDYFRAEVPPEYPFELYHPNGEKKTRDELDQDALEEPFAPWFRRYASRAAFPAEVLSAATQILAVIKCLIRLNVEIGFKAGDGAPHPIFWVAALLTTLAAVGEGTYLASACRLAAEYGQVSSASSGPRSLLRTIGSTLSLPLLAEENDQEDADSTPATPVDEQEERGQSDITGDSNYKANWYDLLSVCSPDAHLLVFAFVFLIAAAVAQVYIPRYLGNILDALADEFSDKDDDAAHHESMFDVPGFIDNVKLLLLASVLAGVFAGIRGSIFTVVGGRVNIRLRVQLMDSLLTQDIGFFDVTKIGDITSRLSSDTTLVGDQVTLNVNVFLRSLVQAMGVLLFMFLVSWQLTIIAFISVPLITLFSNWYGIFVRALTKLMQKKLADGNSVSEAALGSMATVRAFDAAESELVEFEACMQKYLHLNTRAAVAYCGYAAFTTTLPQLVFAVVVWYGGLLVRNGAMTSGQLVSFLLYLSSLSDAFSSVGWVFSSLMQAVGAADKVFELMRREPRMRQPTQVDPPPPVLTENETPGILGVHATKTRQLRLRGRWPESSQGQIDLQNVDLYYPARPNRRVLNGLSLQVQPGSIVALVGESGGGKSSIVSLIEHLYEQSAGKVMIDGMDVHELAPAWLSKHVSVVSQQPVLFGRSIRRNIMYGLEGTAEEPNQEEIEAAARLANADSFIQKMPQK